MKISNMARTAKIAALGLLAAASLLITPAAHAGGVAINPNGPGLGSGSTTRFNDNCDAASAAAASGKAYTAAANCTMSTSAGQMDISFDKNGLPYYVTGFDAQNVGHHFETVSTLSNATYVSGKLWRGPVSESDTYYYESAAPGRFSLGWTNMGPKDKVINGRLFTYKGAVHTRNDTAERYYRIITSIDYQGKTYDDYCGYRFKLAESTAKIMENPQFVAQHNALMVHFDGAGNRHEQGLWSGGSYVPVKCGSYLPGPMPNLNVYADVHNRFNNVEKYKANLRQLYSAWGVDFDTNPLGLFSAAHAKRLSMGRLNFEALTDQEKNDLKTIGQATLAAGGAALLAGASMAWTGPVDLVIVGVTFFVTFDLYLVDKEIDKTKTPDPAPAPSSLNDCYPEDDIDELAYDDESAASGTNSDGTTDDSGGADDGAGSYEGGGCDSAPDTCTPAESTARTRLPSTGNAARLAQ